MSHPMNPVAARPETLLRSVFMEQVPIYKKAMAFSLVISLMTLAPTVFMLEVYDRVINSRSVTTLISLLTCLIGVYVLMEALDLLRGRLLRHAGWRLDESLREQLLDASFQSSLLQGAASIQPFNDLRTLREFSGSPAMVAILDLPSSLIFLALLSLISPWLGLIALVAAAIQMAIAFNTERKTMPALAGANQAAISAQNHASGVLRNAQVISAMGMESRIYARWLKLQNKFLMLQVSASSAASVDSAISKFVQTLQGSLILGLACWFALKGMLLGGDGMIVVASIIGGRVLYPLVHLVGHWRTVVNARDAYQRLDSFLGQGRPEQNRLPLPPHEGRVSVENLSAAAPGTNVLILKGISFALEPGELLIVIGQSASGKSTLARLLTGVWHPVNGKVRLDGADIHSLDKEQLGKNLGYLPQTVELLDGTLAENIARFGDVKSDQIDAAVSSAGLAALCAALPNGVNTPIGYDGAMLSGGQRQAVGLARAIYSDPNLVVLDEPNSNLDEAGEKVLANILLSLKRRGCTSIVITHRKNLLEIADKILVLHEGQVATFGARGDVLSRLAKARERGPSSNASSAAMKPTDIGDAN